MNYEGRLAPLATRAVFLRRVAGHFAVSVVLIVASVAGGMAGYEYFEKMGWRDAFLNAAMLLGGEGPVTTPASPGGKLFAGLYALYSGLVFLVAVAVFLTPVFHRLLHTFHLETRKGGQA